MACRVGILSKNKGGGGGGGGGEDTLLPNEDCNSVLLDKVIDLESDDNLYC